MPTVSAKERAAASPPFALTESRSKREIAASVSAKGWTISRQYRNPPFALTEGTKSDHERSLVSAKGRVERI